jgi:hypothetical protein
MSRFMGQTELKKYIEEYNTKAKTFNIATLAVSSLIKKIRISEFLFDGAIDPDILKFTKASLENRYQRLFGDLIQARSSTIDESLRYNIEVELLRLRLEIDTAPEVEENILVLYETGIEIAKEVDRLIKLDVVETVNYVRYQSAHYPKVSALTTFLEKNLEEELHLSIVAM